MHWDFDSLNKLLLHSVGHRGPKENSEGREKMEICSRGDAHAHGMDFPQGAHRIVPGLSLHACPTNM